MFNVTDVAYLNSINGQVKALIDAISTPCSPCAVADIVFVVETSETLSLPLIAEVK